MTLHVLPKVLFSEPKAHSLKDTCPQSHRGRRTAAIVRLRAYTLLGDLDYGAELC